MKRALLLVIAAACGNDTGAPPQAAMPERVRMLTDEQYVNAVRDLLGIDDVAIHTPGTRPDQFIHDDTVLAVDPATLVQYRLTAERIAKQVGARAIDVDDFASRAFRRPLEPAESAQLAALHAQGGSALVVEAVLQAPSFVYRTERGPELEPYELASTLGFLFLDSVPDEPLWQAARDGSIAQPAVLEAHVERLLAEPRVRAHLTDVVMRWLGLHDIRYVSRADLLYDLPRDSFLEQTRRFVDDVLWERGGSLHELLASQETFIDAALARYYDRTDITDWTRVTSERAGILAHPGVLMMVATPTNETIIQRGIYVHRTLLCTEELGRPPFAAIAATGSLIRGFSEIQIGHFRSAHVHCSDCHRTIDPPGFAMYGYDGLGMPRLALDEDYVTMELDGKRQHIRGATELARALASSDQVARCVADRIAHHALGRAIPDPATRAHLHRGFLEDRDIVGLFRAIATVPLFRSRR